MISSFQSETSGRKHSEKELCEVKSSGHLQDFQELDMSKKDSQVTKVLIVSQSVREMLSPQAFWT